MDQLILSTLINAGIINEAIVISVMLEEILDKARNLYLDNLITIYSNNVVR